MERMAIKEDGLEGLFFVNRFREKQRAVIVLGGSEGGIPFSSPKSEGWMKELVMAGYAVLRLAYCGTGTLPNSLARIALEYFEKAFAWLADQLGVIPSDYALLGGTKGAELTSTGPLKPCAVSS
jgi:hypothetical protein